MTTTTHGTTPVSDLRDGLVARVDERLRTFLDQERAQWATVGNGSTIPIDAIADLIAAGGKRVRPAFCISGYLAAGGDPAGPLIVDAAAALEFLHAFALIHDDVLDDSPLRRGKPTVHVRYAAEHEARGWRGESRRFGEGVAILAGDLAYVFADCLAAEIPLSARRIWSELRAEMIIGQYVDIRAAAESSADRELARWIAICKSGSYTIHRPLVLGAALAGRDDLTGCFEEYGAALGEAFQLRDDQIDAFGTAESAGKPVGHDLEQHKMTTLIALAVERDDNVRALVRSGPASDWDAARLRELLTRSSVRAEVEKHIDELLDRACHAIDAAPIEADWRQTLKDMAFQVAHRDR